MKKRALILAVAASLLLTGCGKGKEASAAVTAPESTQAQAGEMLDLTKLSSTMVFGEVFSMLAEPNRYVGRTVKMSGTSAHLVNPETNERFYACVIADATNCCAQGLEYVLPEGEAYPEPDAEITVTGTFALYYENGYQSFHLVDARLEM